MKGDLQSPCSPKEFREDLQVQLTFRGRCGRFSSPGRQLVRVLVSGPERHGEVLYFPFIQTRFCMVLHTLHMKKAVFRLNSSRKAALNCQDLSSELWTSGEDQGQHTEAGIWNSLLVARHTFNARRRLSSPKNGRARGGVIIDVRAVIVRVSKLGLYAVTSKCHQTPSIVKSTGLAQKQVPQFPLFRRVANPSTPIFGRSSYLETTKTILEICP